MSKKVLLMIVLGFLYLAAGVNLGKIKWDMWHGLNGYAALKNLENPKQDNEYFFRMLLFPKGNDVVAQKAQGLGVVSGSSGKGYPDSGGPSLLTSNISKIGYLVVSAFIAPFTTVAIFFTWLVMLGFTLVVISFFFIFYVLLLPFL